MGSEHKRFSDGQRGRYIHLPQRGRPAVGRIEQRGLTADEMDRRLGRRLAEDSPTDAVGHGKATDLRSVLGCSGLKAARDFAVGVSSQMAGAAAYSFLKGIGLLP